MDLPARKKTVTFDMEDEVDLGELAARYEDEPPTPSKETEGERNIASEPVPESGVEAESQEVEDWNYAEDDEDDEDEDEEYLAGALEWADIRDGKFYTFFPSIIVCRSVKRNFLTRGRIFLCCMKILLCSFFLFCLIVFCVWKYIHEQFMVVVIFVLSG